MRTADAGTLDINQPKESQTRTRRPRHGGLLGTDFRHAVEFSKSGRATTRPFRAPSLAGCPTLRRFPAAPHRGAGPADLPVRAAHGEQYTTISGRARGGPGPIRRLAVSLRTVRGRGPLSEAQEALDPHGE